GNLFARASAGAGGEIYRLDRHPSISQHPVTPMRESDLRIHLGRQTNFAIGLFDVLQYSRPAAEQLAKLETLAKDFDIVLFDALEPQHLAQIGELLDEGAAPQTPRFSIGSSAVESALGPLWQRRDQLRPAEGWPNVAANSPLLVLSGSCSPITGTQIAHAAQQGFVEVRVDAAEIFADAAAADRLLAQAGDLCVQGLASGRSVAVHTSQGNSDPRIASTLQAALDAAPSQQDDATGVQTHISATLGRFLGSLAARCREDANANRICVAGGDTSSHAARAMGIDALTMIKPYVTGAPLCQVSAPGCPLDGCQVNFKGGQVGAVDYFTGLADFS
ncbi:MAG: four-carbon acid sugar kinase family protein, partial [Planctomycetales bacterium]|nr:four-carbon acid sugar kinase family protein [Planctomycetales bacterium]